MGRFSRKFKKSLGNESVVDILNSGRNIKTAKALVLYNRKMNSKQHFINNNLDKLPQSFSKELLNMATANINNKEINNKEINKEEINKEEINKEINNKEINNKENGDNNGE